MNRSSQKTTPPHVRLRRFRGGASRSRGLRICVPLTFLLAFVSSWLTSFHGCHCSQTSSDISCIHRPIRRSPAPSRRAGAWASRSPCAAPLPARWPFSREVGDGKQQIAHLLGARGSDGYRGHHLGQFLDFLRILSMTSPPDSRDRPAARLLSLYAKQRRRLWAVHQSSASFAGGQPLLRLLHVPRERAASADGARSFEPRRAGGHPRGRHADGAAPACRLPRGAPPRH